MTEKNLYFIYSFFLHTVMLAIFLFVFYTKPLSGFKVDQPIDAYIAYEDLHQQKRDHQANDDRVHQHNVSSASEKMMEKSAEKNHANESRVSRKATAVKNSVSTSNLIRLLHQAISAQQYYPPDAIENQQEGVVSVSFTLFPDGSAKNFQIIKSSGFSNLDQAARIAFHHALPFKEVNQYLQQKKIYKINLVYQLA